MKLVDGDCSKMHLFQSFSINWRLEHPKEENSSSLCFEEENDRP